MGKALKRIADILAIIFWFWLYLYVFKLELPKTVFLKKHNDGWKSEVEVLSKEADILEETLDGIEERDDHIYRSIFGLEEAKNDSIDNGKYAVSLSILLERQIDMMKRADLRKKTLSEADALSSRVGDMVACVPSIPPISPDKRLRVSSNFGQRHNPLGRGYEYHEGQDFATFKGNAVYATGDGVVESTNSKFKGYGNEIVINHGFGYKTRYAHLRTIEVVEGMKVSRGERIGSVGSTGRSTGPHLHYEVIYMGAKQNPLRYMDLKMDIKEFRKMVNAQRDKNSRGKKSTTGEIISHTRKTNE